MIKVAEEHDLATDEKIEDICELVEIYQNPLGDWTYYCRPSITSFEMLKKAVSDITRDGTNTWFWDNGNFVWSMEEKFWDWIPYNKIS